MMKKRKSAAPKKSEEEEEEGRGKAAAGAGKKRIACSNSSLQQAPPAVVEAAKVDKTSRRESESEMRWPGGWMKRAGVVVEEQVPWGAMWLPSWDVDYMGDAYVSALYSDVWEGYDDIWGFRSGLN